MQNRQCISEEPTPEHPAPASQSGQDSYVSRAATWGVKGLRQHEQLGHGCNLINWLDLGSEYEGIG